MPRPHLMVVTTAPISLDKLLHGQLAFLNETFAVTAVSAPGRELDTVARREGVAVEVVPMLRQPAPLSDLRALTQLIRLFRRARPDIVHAYTPKAGLLAMLAARLTGVPIRVRSINGLPLMETTGARRRLLTFLERLSIWAATEVMVNSEGLRSVVLDQLTRREVGMISRGSTNGVDTEHFSPDAPDVPNRSDTRERLGIPKEAFVVLFVGRIVRDKGVAELIDAFQSLAAQRGDLRLLLVGGHEAADSLPEQLLRQIAQSPEIVETGFVDDVRPYMLAADLLALPSYREGLPNVLLQGGSMGLPMIASDIPGCRDVLSHNQTGLLVSLKNAEALRKALETLIDDPDRRSRLADSARNDICERFDQSRLWAALRNFYTDLLAARV